MVAIIGHYRRHNWQWNMDSVVKGCVVKGCSDISIN
jgi:hypothetical protein